MSNQDTTQQSNAGAGMTLALSTKKAKSIQPPLKKSELIEAMTQRRYKTQLAEHTEAMEKIKLIGDKLREDTFAAAKKSLEIDTDYQPNFRCEKWSSKEATDDDYSIIVTVKPFKDRSLVRRYRRLLEMKNAAPVLPNINETRKEVRDAVNRTTSDPGERIAALLADKASCNALDATLAALFEAKPTTPQLPAASS